MLAEITVAPGVVGEPDGAVDGVLRGSRESMVES